MGMNAVHKGLKLVTNVDPKTCDRLIGDPLRLRQILFNLTSNAIKFTSQGGVFITARQSEMPEQDDVRENPNKVCITFEVKDTGIGLKPEQLDTIFESFSQADGSTTRKYGGTGLGLAIVKSLVELMNGKVSVTSVQEQGTTFSFTVVFSVSHSDTGMFSSVILLSKRRVLLVDDNANDLEILANHMQSLQMDVSFVRTGAGALEKLIEATQMRSPFELVVVDWRMPRMDGIEVIRRIRQNEGIVPPHILMISAYDRQDCLRQVQGLNVADVLNKPVLPEMFKEAMKAAFRDDLSRQTNEARADLRGAKILLAEDNKINQMVAAEMLKMFHVEITVANDGLEAVEAVKKNDFDLILMDIQMPEMDGLEATQKIRKLNKPGIDKLPILAMTANALDTDYQKSLEMGMNDHLTKPIDPDKLRLALEKWIVR
jgi:CheY-like chemotaxis protein